MHYHTIVSTPGCLPDSDQPAPMYGSATRAWAALSDELQRDWDAEYEATDGSDSTRSWAGAQDAIDARYLPASTQLHCRPAGDFESVFVPGPTLTSLGRVYEVRPCGDDQCVS